MERAVRFIKKNRLLLFVAVVAVCFFLGLFLYSSGTIGLSERAMRREYRDYIEDGRAVSESVGESMAVFLDYSIEEDDYDMSIYVKRKNAIGWFFRYGGSSGALDALSKFYLENNNEYVIANLGTVSIGHIAVEKSDGSQMTITPEQGKPFAYVMDHRWNVVIYDMDGNIVKPVERSM